MADFCISSHFFTFSHPFIRTFVEARLGGITPRAGHRLRSLRVHIGWRWSKESKGFTKESKQICISWFKIKPSSHFSSFFIWTDSYHIPPSHYPSISSIWTPPSLENRLVSGSALATHPTQLPPYRAFPLKAQSSDLSNQTTQLLVQLSRSPMSLTTCKLMVLLSKSQHLSLSRIFRPFKEWQQRFSLD